MFLGAVGLRWGWRGSTTGGDVPRRGLEAPAPDILVPADVVGHLAGE
jgi:hypothetical protein